MSQPCESCARELLDVIPVVMHAIREEMRRHRGVDLSVPQFRALLFIKRNPQSALSNVAAHLGLSLPAVSAMVDGLVHRGLVSRLDSASDRRRVELSLTASGSELLQKARGETIAHFAELLSALTEEEQARLSEALQLLRTIFPVAPAEDR